MGDFGVAFEVIESFIEVDDDTRMQCFGRCESVWMC